MSRPAPSDALTRGGPFELPLGDLETGLERSVDDLRRLRGATVLVTGGTGFLGSWVVASLLHANDRLRLGARLVLLSRRPDQVPLTVRGDVELVAADVRSLPPLGPVDVVVHGAASSSAPYGEGDGEPRAMASTVVHGTEALLETVATSRPRLLFLSSGAVYGPQQAPVAETDPTAPDPAEPRNAYAGAKRLAETLCAAATRAGEVEGVSARLFSFVGPRLPLEAHFAASSFLRDLLGDRPMAVHGDGRPRRSYLYAGDLPEWVWALLLRGSPGQVYNVGSPVPVSIAELAEHVARLHSPPLPVRIDGPPQPGPSPWYVPSTARAELELGLAARTELDTALAKTAAWFFGAR